MKTVAGVLLLAAFAAAQTPNTTSPNSKVVNFGSVMVYCGNAECSLDRYLLSTHGEVRMVLQPGVWDPSHVPVADPRRFRADEIRGDGDVMVLHGNVTITTPGIRIDAEDASFNKAALTITIRGNANVHVVKQPVYGLPEGFRIPTLVSERK